MIVLVQHVFLFTFLVLLKSAEHLSDAYGFKVSYARPSQIVSLFKREIYFRGVFVVALLSAMRWTFH